MVLSTLLLSRTSLLSQTGTLYSLNNNSPLSPLWPLIISVYFPCLWICLLYKVPHGSGVHKMLTLLCLAYFALNNVLKFMHVIALCQNFITFWGWIIFHCMPPLCVYICTHTHTFYLSMNVFMLSWVVFTFGFLWVILLWMWCTDICLSPC